MKNPSLNIGLGLLKSTGGTTKAVSDFQSSLPGSLVAALCPESDLIREGAYHADWTYIKTGSGVLGKIYCRPSALAEIGFIKNLPKIDAVFCHMLYRYNSNLCARIAARQSVPYFVVPHGSLDPWVFTYRKWQKRSWMKLYGRAFIDGANKVIFATKSELRKASESVGINNGIVINWPVDAPLHDPGDSRNRIRGALKIPAHARVVLMFGRVHSCKNPLATIEACAESGLADLHLIIMGPPSDVTREQCEAAGRLLGSKLHWIGSVFGEEKWAYIYASDVYISLSEKENFNYCLAECLAAGIPAIVSPGNDLTEELRDENCAWLLPDYRKDSVINSLIEFHSVSSTVLERMGSAGRRFAIREFSRAVFTRRLNSLVEQAIH